VHIKVVDNSNKWSVSPWVLMCRSIIFYYYYELYSNNFAFSCTKYFMGMLSYNYSKPFLTVKISTQYIRS